MIVRPAALFLLAIIAAAQQLVGQRVLIRKTNPATVTEALKTHLLTQGFQFADGDAKHALLTLDRGMVRQANLINRRTHTNLFHVVMELSFRFKHKGSDLEVSASEQAVGLEDPGEAFRRPVQPGVELEHLQALLDQIKAEIEARSSAPESTARHDSGRC